MSGEYFLEGIVREHSLFFLMKTYGFCQGMSRERSYIRETILCYVQAFLLSEKAMKNFFLHKNKRKLLFSQKKNQKKTFVREIRGRINYMRGKYFFKGIDGKLLFVEKCLEEGKMFVMKSGKFSFFSVKMYLSGKST